MLAQPAAAGDGGTFKSATAGYGQGLAGAAFAAPQQRISGNLARACRRRGRPVHDAFAELSRTAAPSYFRVCAGLVRDPRRWHSECVRSVHRQRGWRRRYGDSRRARQHPIGRVDSHGERHKAKHSWQFLDNSACVFGRRLSCRRLSRAWMLCQAEYWVERAIPYSRKAEVGIAPPGLGVEYLCPFMPKIGKLADEPPLPSAEMG